MGHLAIVNTEAINRACQQFVAVCRSLGLLAGSVVAIDGSKFRRALGEHRYEVTDPVVSGEAGEQGHADVHHAPGLRDHDGASPEAG